MKMGFITKVQYNDIDGEWFWAYSDFEDFLFDSFTN